MNILFFLNIGCWLSHFDQLIFGKGCLNHHPVDVSPPKVFGSVSWLVDSSYESYVQNIPFNGWPTRFAWKSIYILERQHHMINTLCFHAKSCQSHAKVGLSCAWFHPDLNLDLLKQPGFRLNLGLFDPFLWIYVDQTFMLFIHFARLTTTITPAIMIGGQWRSYHIPQSYCVSTLAGGSWWFLSNLITLVCWNRASELLKTSFLLGRASQV